QLRPGQTAPFMILRGEEYIDLDVPIGEYPKKTREAERTFFERLGLTIKEFVYEDALKNQIYDQNYKGVIAHYLKPDSPAKDAELQPGDWILEVDSTPIQNYKQAVDILQKIEDD